ncbi:MAG: hypothetical protein L0271_17865 [Gemmatimonadetes bacterium]|nr:hypothetical protein [Gemmatimonadota bacterium]
MRVLRAVFHSVVLASLAWPLAAQRPAGEIKGIPESVLLRFQIIEADGFTATDPAIADVTQALRELFRFRGYRLAAESVVRVTSGAEYRQTTTDADGTEYVIEGLASMRGDGKSDAVRLEVNLNRMHPPNVNQNLIRTSLTVPVGQTVVVGSARASGELPVVILVVRPEAR